MRGCAGLRAHGTADAADHTESGFAGDDALQSVHRRHGQGPSGARAGRAGRRDGPRHRRRVHPVAHAEHRQGPGGAFPARSGRQEGLSAAHAPGGGRLRKPRSAAGGDSADSGGERPGEGRGDHHRLPGGLPRRGGLLRRVSEQPHHHRRMLVERRPAGADGRQRADGEPRRSGLPHPSVQDRHARAAGRPNHRLFPDGAPVRRRSHRAVLVPDRPGGTEKPRAVLSDLHHAGDPSHHSGQPRPRAHVRGRHPRHRRALLPVHRGQGGALQGQGAPSRSSWSPRG